MIWATIKNELFRVIFAVIMIFSAAFLYMYTENSDNKNFSNDEKNYLDLHSDIYDFTASLPDDIQRSKDTYFSIDNLEGYYDKDNRPADNLMAVLAGEYSYNKAEMLWRSRQYNSAGFATKTKLRDYEFFLYMTDEYEPTMDYMRFVSDSIKRNTALLKKSRSSENDRIQAECEIDYFSAMPENIPYTANVCGVNIYAPMFSGDIFFSFFIAIISFGMYTKYKQSRYIDYIKTTKCGTKKFCSKQFFTFAIIFTFVYILYCAMYFLMIVMYSSDMSVLALPMQICKDVRFSVLPLSIGQYLAVMMAVKYLYYFVAFAVCALISCLASVTYVSMTLCLTVGSLPAAFRMLGIDGTVARIISGNLIPFINNTNITVVLNSAIPNIMLIGLLYLLLAVIICISCIASGAIRFGNGKWKRKLYVKSSLKI